MSTRSMLVAALYLADLGRRVFPLRERGKEPIVRRGFRDSTRDEKIIRAWWTKSPRANIGLMCGEGLLVLDVDGKEGRRSLRRLTRKHGPLPMTVESSTGNGRHLFFGYPTKQEIRSSASRIGAKLDIRADGGYVAAPPSVHASGRLYRWRRKPGRWPVARAPSWLLRLCGQAEAQRQAGIEHKSADRGSSGSPGARHPPSASGAGQDWRRVLAMIRAGASDEDIAAALHKSAKSSRYSAGARGEKYIEETIANARGWSAESRVRATAREARFELSGASFGRPEFAKVKLVLVTDDGDVVRVGVVLPTAGQRSAAATWAGCFPDFQDVEALLKSHLVREELVVETRGRRFEFEVDASGGDVSWIRAVAAEDAPRRPSVGGAPPGLPEDPPQPRRGREEDEEDRG